jgi:hypothetical protein
MNSNPVILNFQRSLGAGPDGFAFVISWATNVSVVVESCSNLANATWVSLQTVRLTNGAYYLNDPNWKNYHAHFYRIRSP